MVPRNTNGWSVASKIWDLVSMNLYEFIESQVGEDPAKINY